MSTLFIALPLLFGFLTPLFEKFGKNSVAYISTFMQFILFLLSVKLLFTTSLHIDVISIAQPLGISFVLSKVSLVFVTLFSAIVTIFSLYYLSYRKINPYQNETKFFILLNMLLASVIVSGCPIKL